MSKSSVVSQRDPAPAETILLWGQVASAAAVPLALVFCQLGLAVGDPVLPPELEILLLGAVPIAAMTGLQWWRPLYPFGIWVQYQAPETLTETQRQILVRMLPDRHQPWLHPQGWLAVVAGGFTYAVFRQLYAMAPAVEGAVWLPSYLRLVGVLWAALWIGMATGLLQAAIAAARLLILMNEPARGDRDGALSVDQIQQAFTYVGWEGGALLAFLGVPKPVDAIGRAVVTTEGEESHEAEAAAATTSEPVSEPVPSAEPTAEPTAEPKVAQPSAPVPVAPIAEAVVSTEAVREADREEVPAAEAEVLDNPIASAGPEATAEPASEVRSETVVTEVLPEPVSEQAVPKVTIEPLVAPVFVNVVEDTSQPSA